MNKKPYFLGLILIIGSVIAGLIIDDGGLSLQDLYQASIKSHTHETFVSSGVVPHHLLAKKIIQDFFNYLSGSHKIDTVVLLSPDHFKSGKLVSENSFISVNSEEKNINGLSIDNFLLKKITTQDDFVLDKNLLTNEHGITALLPYIKEELPQASILPIIVPSEISEEKIEKLIKNIDAYSSDSAVVIASVDFSHYLPRNAANFHDIKSIRTLLNFEQDNFPDLEVDCWQCLYGARFFASLREKETPYIIAHKNSLNFSSLNSEETTSYFSVIFDDEKTQSSYYESLTNSKTVLFMGDIMLDRGVEYFTEQNSISYAFQKISDFLRGIDLVVGNLEGPIVENPPYLGPYSYRFACRPEMAQVLSSAYFNILSLANNHTHDMGKEGIQYTKKLLQENNIDFMGDPVSCDPQLSFQDENLVLFAVNKTFPFNCSEEEIISQVKNLRSLYPDKFLIVIFHWGHEYHLTSSPLQQQQAHKAIEAGADLIIGHHPHVVQNIEGYKGRLIFYSLGNFIFDQSFSQDTSQGLAVGLEIYPKRLVYRLFPLDIIRAQPQLMDTAKRDVFLEQLAERSDGELLDSIRKGIIIIDQE